MAQILPAQPIPFEMAQQHMGRPEFPDPNAFVMIPRRPVLRIETRPRWACSILNRPPEDQANAEYRRFQIECYTSLPPRSPADLDVSPVAPRGNWAYPQAPFLWLYHLLSVLFVALTFLLLTAATAATSGMALLGGLRKMGDSMYDIWAPRKLRMMQFTSSALPCLLCATFLLTMLFNPPSEEESLEFELRHNCVIRSGPFEFPDGPQRRY